MLIKITNYCSMGCNHCMENSTVQGMHMERSVFSESLEFTARAEHLAYKMGAPRLVLLSGGECTEHPDFLWFVEQTKIAGFVPLVITNGNWLKDEKRKLEIMSTDSMFQVTNDTRFYPEKIEEIRHKQISFVGSLSHLLPLGRARGKDGKIRLALQDSGINSKLSPTSFNLRSLTKSMFSFEKAIATLRIRAASGLSGHCSPSIREDGIVVAGETRFCYEIGSIKDDLETITQKIISMKSCNRCGLEDNLSAMHRNAISI